MLRLKLITLVLLIIFAGKASSETIIVSSNADSGPNTLRAALQRTIDNDTTETDYIHFNLGSSTMDRTIRLRSQLPVVTSNVVIDGSTQPGAPLGISGAKVIIEPENSPVNFPGLVIGSSYSAIISNIPPTNNVEVYGLYIRKFGLISNILNPGPNTNCGIILDYRVNNVRIGKPGKGNVICGNYAGIFVRNSYFYNNITSLSKIIIQSNFIGVLDDGNTEQINFIGISLDISNYDVSIGGDNAGEGNVISANGTGVIVNHNYSYSSLRPSLNIISNKIGTNFAGTRDYKELPVFMQSSSVEMYGIKVNAAATDVTILKNIISGQRKWGISITNSDFLIAGNKIGTGVAGTENLGNDGGIRIESGTAQGTVGGSAADDINYIGYNRYGIETVSSKPIEITQNSFFCNEVFGIGKSFSAPQAYIQVLKIRSDYISGKASPNAKIELFYTDNCSGSCQGKTYIATERAGNDGRWEYNGPLSGNVTATATLPAAVTSPFSTVALFDNEAIIDPVTCNGNGKITITEPREGITFDWYKLENDGSSVFLSHDQSVTNLAVGTYQLKLNDGCKETSHQFAITDQILTKPEIIAPSPACGQVSFPFRAQTLRGKGNIRYEWVNAAGNVVANGQQVNLPEGKYFVRAKDDAGCSVPSDPVTIVKRPAPIINLSAMVIKTAACGLIDGAIKGIRATPGVGTVSYKWYRWDTSNSTISTEMSQTADLIDVDGGYYVLEVTDQSDCSPVRTNPIFVQTTNSVVISGGTTVPATCNTTNGDIRNITISNANRYDWKGPDGTIIESGNYSTGIVLKLEDRAPGTYTLTAKNTLTGCSNTRSFTIFQVSPTVYTYSINATATTCGLNNGSIKLTFSSVQAIKYEWMDASGTVIPGTATELRNLAPGEYRYYTYDENNCENISNAIIINQTPLLKVIPASASVTNDGCALKNGMVTGIQVIGGIPPYKYKWVNREGKEAGYEQDLKQISLGEYKVYVTDQTSCGIDSSEYYAVDDLTFEVRKPSANDLRVCYRSEIMLPVNEPETGTYQLFKDTTDLAPVLESTNGKFIYEAAKTEDLYLRLKVGRCLSDFHKLRIEVINDNLEIMNTMTPNGDGKNDTWVIRGLPDNNNEMTIHVYNRDGQLIYESVGQYLAPFDGTFIGNSLPKGVYYYKIDLKSGCKPLAGSITLLR